MIAFHAIMLKLVEESYVTVVVLVKRQANHNDSMHLDLWTWSTQSVEVQTDHRNGEER